MPKSTDVSDTFRKATIVEPINQFINSSLETANDLDVFKFTIAGEENRQFSLTVEGATDTEIALYNANGALIYFDPQDGAHIDGALIPGTYYAVVSEGDNMPTGGNALRGRTPAGPDYTDTGDSTGSYILNMQVWV